MVRAQAGQLERDLGIGHTQLGLWATVSGGVGSAAPVPMGLLTDRVRRHVAVDVHSPPSRRSAGQ